MAGSGRLASEEQLFRAFCAKANPGFKLAMAIPPFSVDLDQLAEPLPYDVPGSDIRASRISELLNRLEGRARHHYDGP